MDEISLLAKEYAMGRFFSVENDAHLALLYDWFFFRWEDKKLSPAMKMIDLASEFSDHLGEEVHLVYEDAFKNIPAILFVDMLLDAYRDYVSFGNSCQSLTF